LALEEQGQQLLLAALMEVILFSALLPPLGAGVVLEQTYPRGTQKQVLLVVLEVVLAIGLALDLLLEAQVTLPR